MEMKKDATFFSIIIICSLTLFMIVTTEMFKNACWNGTRENVVLNLLREKVIGRT